MEDEFHALHSLMAIRTYTIDMYVSRDTDDPVV